MPGRILVGVNGSQGSHRALAWAAEDAVARGAVVDAVTVCRGGGDDIEARYSPYQTSHLIDRPAHQMADEARQRLHAAVAEVAVGLPDVEFQARVLQGDPAETLCRQAEDADLLVVGACGRSTFSALLLGSVANKCVRHCQVTVVVVPTGPDGTPLHEPTRPGRIVVGVDMSAGSRRALRWALDEAAARSWSVQAVTVWARADSYGDADLSWPRDDAIGTQAKRELDKLVEEVTSEAPPVTVTSLAFEGDPSRRLSELARGAELLVVGDRGRGGLASLLLGSVASKCAHHSPHPIAIVRRQRAEVDARR